MVNNQWIVVLGLGLSTMIPRILPLFLLKDKDLSPKLVQWMSYIPVTIFSALVFSDIFFWDEKFMMNPLENLKLLPSLFVIFISIKVNNLFISMLAGVVAIALMVWGLS